MPLSQSAFISSPSANKAMSNKCANSGEEHFKRVNILNVLINCLRCQQVGKNWASIQHVPPSIEPLNPTYLLDEAIPSPSMWVFEPPKCVLSFVAFDGLRMAGAT